MSGALQLDRKVPVPWLLSGAAALVVSAGACVWNVANIARDVAEIKAGVERGAVRQDAFGERIEALTRRVDRLEYSTGKEQGK